MPSILRISEAAALGLHTMAMLAEEPDQRISNHQIAEALHASEHHVPKVLQRLAKGGLVRSARGPKGGFVLAMPAEDITLLDVYECIEGPLRPNYCLLDPPICGGEHCILGGLVVTVTEQFCEYLKKTTLADLAKRIRIPAPA